jgi:RNA polymerase sigma-70 factor, ECF subfamily
MDNRPENASEGKWMRDSLPFEAFMQNYQNMVYTTAARILGNEAEAEDIAQEVFLKAFERYDSLASSPTAGGWLKTVATNLALNYLSRYRARWRFFSEMRSEGEDDEREMELPAPEVPDQDAEIIDQRRIIEATLQKLPTTQRVPLVLYHFEGMRYEEIAQRLGVTLSKVKTDIFRGREALRNRLKWRLDESDSCPSSPSAESHTTTKWSSQPIKCA